MRTLTAFLVLSGAALAQFPGQTPFPIPGRLPQPTTRGPQPSPQPTRTAALETRATAGILRQLSRRELIIQSDDDRVIWYRIGDDVEVAPEKFHAGDHLTVTSAQDEEGNYTAVSVQWESAATDADRTRAQQTWDLPNSESSDRVRTGPLPTRPDDPAITAAREAAATFIDDLPNFAAKQNTTRFLQESARAQWRALDVVTADLIYKNGSEEYSNIKIGNKPTNKPLEEIQGLRSTGEFGSILGDLLDPETGVDFTRPSQVIEKGHKAWKYRFTAPRERSDFRITTPSQHYYTGYSGSVWIDFDSSRVLRIEMQAVNLPKAFPFDTVEMTIDYDFIRLDGAKQFLLPTESQALNCIRGTSVCMKNTTSFRNYVKFTSESSITFDAPK
jgi:hypothetical protein